MMFKRVMVAVIGITVLVGIFDFAPAWAAMLLVAAMCGIGAHELMHAAAGETGKRLIPLTVIVAALVPMCIYGQSAASAYAAERTMQEGTIMSLYGLMSGGRTCCVWPVQELVALLFLLALFVYAILHYAKETAIPFSTLTAALFAGLVFPMMLSCLLRLRLLPFGALLVWMPLAISFGSDTFALFAGLVCGKHKLAPRVSPKKTVEGAVGGLLGGVIGMALFRLIAGGIGIFPIQEYEGMGYTLSSGGRILMSWGAVVCLGLLGSVVSQIGDLSYSVIKREFGVKDYGNLLPGHGGILDRFDSVTFVAPFVWFIFSFL